MLLKNKLSEIKKSLDNSNVLTSLEERYCYSQDACNIVSHSKIPDLVVFVETIEDVQTVVKYANLHEIPIVARGAGTNMVGACACTHGGIVLNFTKMNKILDLNKTNMTVTVEPGVILGDLKDEVEKLGLFYPPDPSSYKVSTIGGSIAQSSGGAYSFKYGTTKDYVLSLKLVMADGTLMTVGANTVKDSVGYHLAQLMVGSEGTLGIIVEATLKLIPKPASKAVISAFFDNVNSALNSINNIIDKGLFPAAIDFMDRNSIITVEDYAQIGLDKEANNMVIIELDGDIISTSNSLAIAEQVLRENNGYKIIISASEIEAEKLWQARRASYAATARLAPDVVSDDIIVPRDKLSIMISACGEIAKRYNLKMCLIGHIGDGNLHPQIALNLNNEEEFRNLLSAKSDMYKLAIELGGTISGEHGIGIEKQMFLENALDNNALEYMKIIKKSFDPKNILNPGKIFDLI